jgi:hypothetical protein
MKNKRTSSTNINVEKTYQNSDEKNSINDIKMKILS